MRAILLLTAIEDETLSPNEVKVLYVDSEGRLVTMVITRSLYTKWVSDVRQLSVQNNTYCALVDITLTGEGVSQSHVVAITEDEARVLDKIVDLAVNHAESIPEDGKIPKEMRWAPSRIIDNVVRHIEMDKNYFLDREKTIAENIGKDTLIDLERKGVFIEDIKGKSILALCMWKMGVQLKGRNSYVMLTFTTDGRFQPTIIEMEPTIKDAKDAVCRLFDVSNPIELFVERARFSFKNLMEQLKPTHLLNPRYIPTAAVMPHRNDNRICLCLEVAGEFLQVGLMLETTQPVMARVKKDRKEMASITNFISDVCKGYLLRMPFSEDCMASLAGLLATVEAENLSLITSKNENIV